MQNAKDILKESLATVAVTLALWSPIIISAQHQNPTSATRPVKNIQNRIPIDPLKFDID